MAQAPAFTGVVAPPITAQQLAAAIGRLPRVPLVAVRPMPLEECPRFAAAICATARVLVKRDDLTGVGFGGNKVRNLEFRLAEAMAQRADTLILGVDILSNSARQTAAAANRLGLRYVLVLVGSAPPDPPQGNLLLDRLLGAEIHFVPDTPAQQDTMQQRARELRAAGRRPYIMTDSPVFAQAAAAAYAECTLEILAQHREQGLGPPDRLYISSSGKGVAGLIGDVRQGLIGPHDTVVFVHTGGLPLIFDLNADLLPILS